jgi:ATP-binding cassette subfamily C (CFTR/MRP) protein 1
MEPIITAVRYDFDDVPLAPFGADEPGQAVIYVDEDTSKKPPQKDLWGTAPAYSSCPEDDASLASRMTYSWVRPYIQLAADEKLTADLMTPVQSDFRNIVVGKKLSDDFKVQLDCRNSWNGLCGQRVALLSSPECVGTLKWVGYAVQSSVPDALLAAVDWTGQPPKGLAVFSSGTIDGEWLFDGSGTITLLPPARLKLLGSHQHVGTPPTKPSITASLRRVLFNELWIQVPTKLVGDVAMLSAPVALELFVQFLESDTPSLSRGLPIAALIFFIGLTQSLFMHKYYQISIRAGTLCRSALLGVLFEKCFTIAPKAMALPEMSVGRIVNMVSSDVEKAADFNERLMYLLSAPLQLIVCILLLYRLVGWCALVGVAVLVVTIPIQTWSVEKQHTIRKSLMKAADLRVKATNEFFTGIRIVKYMGWELRFIETIAARRREELLALRQIQKWRVVTALVNIASPVIVIATVFIIYHATGNDLTPSIVFPTISLLGIMRLPFMNIPMSITSAVQFMIGMRRISKFLECDENDGSVIASIDKYTSPSSSETRASELSAVYQNATLSAFVAQKLPATSQLPPASCLQATLPSVFTPPAPRKEQFFQVVKKDLLKSVNLRIPKGKLTVLLGPTGSGKSTLLESLVGQFAVTEGKVWAEKSIAFVPQQPWIMNATVEGNILFFSPKEAGHFHNVIDCCELASDLEALISGLDTEIGEKGVNLSGGQRARVSLARAVYAKKDLYLLDDPLSALDAHVGHQILNRCILGELSHATRILATHHVHVAQRADYVIVLADGGQIQFAGSAAEYRTHCGHAAVSASEDEEQASNGPSAATSPTGKSEPVVTAKASTEKGKIISAEEKAIGSVPWSTYQKYFDAAGGTSAVVSVLVVYFFTECLNLSGSVWLSLWSVQQWHLPSLTYLQVYLVLVAVGLCSPVLRYLRSYAVMTRASLNLHNTLLGSVSMATMAFFDTTPLGRILNRFTRDMDQIDNALQMSLIFCLQLLFQVLGSFIIMVISQPLVLIPLVPCSIIYYRLLVFYNSANREIRRVSSNIVSPMFALLTESLQGSRTILAFGKANVVMEEGMRRIDRIFSSNYMQNVCNRWLGIRIELIGNLVVTSVACACAFGRVYSFGSGNVGLLSLGLTMSMQITGLLNWIIRQIASVESEMNSIERVVYYVDNIEHEDLPEIAAAVAASHSNTAPPPARNFSPAEVAATIEFRDVALSYRPGLPLVLNRLSFSIQAGQKVGVVGRTGSGKSTLLLAFLRIVDTCGGSILVGGQDSSRFTLREMRSLFSIIPQDPLLFEGTVRSNLDPFSESSDSELWTTLERVGMKGRIESDVKGLAAPVLDGGSNFSVGQRQLLCMARALQKKGSRFILMDEATANIDPELDKLIQRTVADVFAAHTVVTIAHRLHTIIDYDRILFMDKGFAAEFDTPAALVARPNGLFRGLVASQGQEQEAALIAMIDSHMNKKAKN